MLERRRKRDTGTITWRERNEIDLWLIIYFYGKPVGDTPRIASIDRRNMRVYSYRRTREICPEYIKTIRQQYLYREVGIKFTSAYINLS